MMDGVGRGGKEIGGVLGTRLSKIMYDMYLYMYMYCT